MLASGFVIRPYENDDYEVPDDIPGGDKLLDMGEEETDLNYEDLPRPWLTNIPKVPNITHSTTTDVYDSNEGYGDVTISPPEYIMHTYHDPINH